MSGEAEALDLERLRRDFDLGFAAPPRAERAAAGGPLLAVEAGGRPCALRLEELAFLASGVEPAPYASDAPAFLGLAGFRGGVLPVWDLAALLGWPPGPGRPAWAAGVAGPRRWAAAFGAYGGLLPAGSGEILPLDALGAGGPRFTAGVLEHGGTRRPILDLGALSESIRVLHEGSRER